MKAIKTISVVAPVYNEEEVIFEFNRRLMAVLNSIPYSIQVVYVNDGSTDSSYQKLLTLKKQYPSIAILNLSRNFGKEIAMTAGLDQAIGDAVIVIDTDLQDPPELIPEFIKHWNEGYDIVYGKRIERHGETWLKKASAYWFYRTISKVSEVKIPKDVGDFRLLSRRALHGLLQLREKHRFMKGLFSWVGFSQKAVEYTRDKRHAGDTKWNYWKLWNFALEGITSFTVRPLVISTYAGILTAVAAFIYGCFTLVKTLIYGNPTPGYTSLMVVILFLGGVQLIAVGLIGEYVGRMFNETKNRPLYLIQEFIPSSNKVNETSASNRSGSDAAYEY